MFADIKFREGRGVGATFEAMFRATVNAMQDSELPVRVDACMAVRMFVDAIEEIEPIKPVVPQILHSVLKVRFVYP